MKLSCFTLAKVVFIFENRSLEHVTQCVSDERQFIAYIDFTAFKRLVKCLILAEPGLKEL